VFEVGKPYNPRIRLWREGPHLRLTPAGCELVLFYAGPAAQEILDVRQGAARFAWIDAGPASVLCYQIGTMPWSDAPYEPWKEPAAARGVPAGGPGNGLPLTVLLVDAATGIIEAIRITTWSASFAQAVRETVTRQLAAPRDDSAAARALDDLYGRYDSQTLAARAMAACTGGAEDAPLPRAEAEIGSHIAGVVPGKQYPRPLPRDLAAWYVYTVDGGHSIAIAIAAHYAPGADPREFLVPAPVKAVLRRGWSVQDGWIVCDLPYEQLSGLVTDPGEDEY
jgi:hypothetical protein